MPSPLHLVLDRLDHVREIRPGQYRAKCPSHDGKSTDSLSVSEGKDGSVLLHCWGACPNEDVVAARSDPQGPVPPSRSVPGAAPRLRRREEPRGNPPRAGSRADMPAPDRDRTDSTTGRSKIRTRKAANARRGADPHRPGSFCMPRGNAVTDEELAAFDRAHGTAPLGEKRKTSEIPQDRADTWPDPADIRSPADAEPYPVAALPFGRPRGDRRICPLRPATGYRSSGARPWLRWPSLRKGSPTWRAMLT
jgi:hypothetical protein